MDINERLRLYLNRKPNTENALFVAPNATVIGDVTLGRLSSIWYGAVLTQVRHLSQVSTTCGFR